jgi:putative FmdB family regulatory protein
MPTYEYLCSNCGNAWEEVQKISEPALQVCPKCSKRTAKRQISAGNFILKGGGWYSDSYSSPKPSASKSDSGDSGGPSKATAKDDSGGSAKAESKPKESSAPPKTESSAPKATGGSSGGEGKSS